MSATLKEQIKGTWWLLSRIDKNSEGAIVEDPVLGSDPVAILVYSETHFAAQFMKRDRSEIPSDIVSSAGLNNTSAIGGYDAYFGTYEITGKDNIVRHTLTGSVNSDNIGLSVERQLTVESGKLKIQLETTSVSGQKVTRTLTWERI